MKQYSILPGTDNQEGQAPSSLWSANWLPRCGGTMIVTGVTMFALFASYLGYHNAGDSYGFTTLAEPEMVKEVAAYPRRLSRMEKAESLYGMREFAGRSWLEHIESLDDEGLAPATKWTARYIFEHQNPPLDQCADRKYLMVHRGKKKLNSHGLGSTINMLSWGLSTAIQHDRILVWGDDESFGGAYVEPDCLVDGIRSLDCIFEPLSHCPRSWFEEKNIVHAIVDRPAAEFNNVPTKETIPPEIATHLLNAMPFEFSGSGAKYWWRTQAAAYLMRLNQQSLEHISNFRLNQTNHMSFTAMNPSGRKGRTFRMPFPLPRGTVSMHVRHGDKYKEMDLVPLTEYARKAEELAALNPNAYGKTAFVSSEDPSLLRKMQGIRHLSKSTAPQEDFIWYWSLIGRANTGPIVQLAELGNRTETTLSWMSELMQAMECDAFIGTRGSNWNRIIDGLRSTSTYIMGGAAGLNSPPRPPSLTSSISSGSSASSISAASTAPSFPFPTLANTKRSSYQHPPSHPLTLQPRIIARSRRTSLPANLVTTNLNLNLSSVGSAAPGSKLPRGMVVGAGNRMSIASVTSVASVSSFESLLEAEEDAVEAALIEGRANERPDEKRANMPLSFQMAGKGLNSRPNVQHRYSLPTPPPSRVQLGLGLPVPPLSRSRAASPLGGERRRSQADDEERKKREQRRWRVAIELRETEKTYVNVLQRIDQTLEDAVPDMPSSPVPVPLPNSASPFGGSNSPAGGSPELSHSASTASSSGPSTPERRDDEFEPPRDKSRKSEKRPPGPPLVLGGALLPILPFLKSYSLFISNFSTAVARIAALEDTSTDEPGSWKDFADKKRGGKGLGLADLLLSIVQRVPRYRLVIGDLVRFTERDHPDRKDLKKAFDIVDGVATHFESQIGAHTNVHQILDLQRRFTNLDAPLVAPGRKLLKVGMVRKLDRRGYEQDRVLLLFNDLLVHASGGSGTDDVVPVSKRSSVGSASGVTASSGATFRFHRRFELGDVTVVGKEDDKGSYGFEILTPEKSFAVFADCLDAKSSWLEAIRDAKADLLRDRRTLQRDADSEEQLQRRRDRRISLPASALTSLSPPPRKLTSLPPSLDLIPATPSPGATDINPFPFTESPTPLDADKQLLPPKPPALVTSVSDGVIPARSRRWSDSVPSAAAAALGLKDDEVEVDYRVIENYSAPVWVPDSKAERCMKICGNVTFVIPANDDDTPDRLARACDTCFENVFGAPPDQSLHQASTVAAPAYSAHLSLNATVSPDKGVAGLPTPTIREPTGYFDGLNTHAPALAVSHLNSILSR
ncbi:Rho guanine nucleotide exchange factor [Pseudohyphozyma bogoriensis]|nr:Rho guanine nucleotide exchange factor [Pseudohyphozyma bogoriensis]